MKRKVFFTIFIGTIGGLFIGCNSDNTINCPENFTGALAQDEEKLTGDWTLSAITSDQEIDLTDDQEDNPDKDIYAQYSECQKDGAYSFESDRKYTFRQGEKITDCQNKSSSEGSWKLTSGTLSLTGACNVQSFMINFNEDNSEFSFSDDFNVLDIDGTNVQTKITFTYSNTP